MTPVCLAIGNWKVKLMVSELGKTGVEKIKCPGKV